MEPVVRRIHRSDNNALDLCRYARALGAFVYPLGRPTDYLVGYRSTWNLVEIKNPEKEGHKREFTKAQMQFWAETIAKKLPVFVWRTTSDVDRDLKGFGEK